MLDTVNTRDDGQISVTLLLIRHVNGVAHKDVAVDALMTDLIQGSLKLLDPSVPGLSDVLLMP